MLTDYKRGKSGCRGISLIECLIYISGFAVLAAVFYPAVSKAVTLMDRTSTTLAIADASSIALKAVADDIRQAEDVSFSDKVLLIKGPFNRTKYFLKESMLHRTEGKEDTVLPGRYSSFSVVQDKTLPRFYIVELQSPLDKLGREGPTATFQAGATIRSRKGEEE